MTNIAIGDVTNSAVVIGNDNFVVNLGTVEAGATVNIVKPDAKPKYSPQPAPVLKLPRPFPSLIGRDKELALLRGDIDSANIVSLWARKGMGKTSIARYLSNTLNKEDPSRSIVYLDALGLGREDLLQALFDVYFESASSYAPAPATIPNALQKVKSLVFVDNLGLSGDDVESLLNAAPGCAFVLISNERALSGEGDALPLQGLPEASGTSLFEKEFGRPLDDAEKEVAARICAVLNGCPDDIIRTGDRGREAQKTPVELLTELRGSGVEDKSLASVATADLSETDRKVLSFLAAAGENAVPAEVLQKAFQGMDVSAELERLKGLNLVQSHSPRYSLCGTLATGMAQMWDLSPWKDMLLDTATSWLAQQPASEAVEGSLGMMLHALDDAAQRQKWRDVLRLGRLLERFVVYYKRWQAWSDVLDLVLQAARALGDRLVEGWALHQLGSRLLAQGAFDAARSNLSQALKIREALHDRAGVEVTRHNLDVLKAAAASHGGNASGQAGSAGARPLTIGFLGFAGLAILAAAGYFLMQRGNRPQPTQPVVPPVMASTVAATLTPSPTASFTASPTLTTTPTETATTTPTWTPSPTDTPVVGTPFAAVVIADQFLACRYGPGQPYLSDNELTLTTGAPVEVLGWADTAPGPWAFVRYSPTYSKVLRPCWANPRYLKMDGNLVTLPQVYVDKILPLFTDPAFVPSVFPPPSNVMASRDGNQVQISWTGKDLAPGDRESPTSPIFLLELWTCLNGKIAFTPLGWTAPYDSSQPDFSGVAFIQDDAGCSEPSHGQVYLAHKDGYVGPVAIPWPPQ